MGIYRDQIIDLTEVQEHFAIEWPQILNYTSEDWVDEDPNENFIYCWRTVSAPAANTILWVLWEYYVSPNSVSSDHRYQFYTLCPWTQTQGGYYSLTAYWSGHGGYPTSNTAGNSAANSSHIFSEFRIKTMTDVEGDSMDWFYYAYTKQVTINPDGTVSLSTLDCEHFHPLKVYKMIESWS